MLVTDDAKVVVAAVREEAESVRVPAESVKVDVASVKVVTASVAVEAAYVNDVAPTVYVPVPVPSVGNCANKKSDAFIPPATPQI